MPWLARRRFPHRRLAARICRRSRTIVPSKTKHRVQRAIVGSTREEILAAIHGASCAMPARTAESKRRHPKPSKSKTRQVKS